MQEHRSECKPITRPVISFGLVVLLVPLCALYLLTHSPLLFSVSLSLLPNPSVYSRRIPAENTVANIIGYRPSARTHNRCNCRAHQVSKRARIANEHYSVTSADWLLEKCDSPLALMRLNKSQKEIKRIDVACIYKRSATAVD